MMDITSIAIIATVVFGGNGVVGLAIWGLKGKIRADLAEQENRIIARINGGYVRTDLCNSRHEKYGRED